MQSIKELGKRSVEDSEKYWDQYYKKAEMLQESTFCRFVKKQLDRNSLVLDIGCGTGRDSFSFAADGFDVVGIDRSKEVIKNNKNKKEEKFTASKLEFREVDLGDTRTLSEVIESLSRKGKSEEKQIVVYLRFLLHSIDEKTEENMLTTLSELLPKGSLLAAEFRTIEDESRNKVYDDHYRRFIVAEDLVRDLENNYHFTLKEFTKGTGLLVYKNEDPYLARILMVKR